MERLQIDFSRTLFFLLVILFSSTDNLLAQRNDDGYFVAAHATSNYNEWESRKFNNKGPQYRGAKKVLGITFYVQPFYVPAEDLEKVKNRLQNYLECKYEDDIGVNGVDVQVRWVPVNEFEYGRMDSAANDYFYEQFAFTRSLYSDSKSSNLSYHKGAMLVWAHEVVNVDHLEGYKNVLESCINYIPSTSISRISSIGFKTINLGIGEIDREVRPFSVEYGMHAKIGFLAVEGGFNFNRNYTNMTVGIPVSLGLALGSDKIGLLVTGGSSIDYLVQNDNEESEDFVIMPYGYAASFYFLFNRYASKGIYLRFNHNLGSFVGPERASGLPPVYMVSIGFAFGA